MLQTWSMGLDLLLCAQCVWLHLAGEQQGEHWQTPALLANKISQGITKLTPHRFAAAASPGSALIQPFSARHTCPPALCPFAPELLQRRRYVPSTQAWLV